MIKLKRDNNVTDFDKLEKEQYEFLKECKLLHINYPFVTGDSFEKDLSLYRTFIGAGF